VFIVSVEIYFFGLLIYLILGTGVKQSWANGKTRTNTRLINTQKTDITIQG